MWYDPFAAPVPQCTLAAQALLPPAVSWTAFAWNAASLWIAGFLNGGFLVGTLLAVFALVIASRMSSAAVVRVFSFVPIAAVATILCILAYHSEVRATIAAAFPQ